MHLALWILQSFVAVVVAITGSVKVVSTRERLSSRMHWAATWPRWRIKLLGVAEVAGALGLVLPIATGIAPLLTPLAAVCISVLMAGAIHTHHQHGEPFVAAAVICVLSLAIAAGRLA